MCLWTLKSKGYPAEQVLGSSPLISSKLQNANVLPVLQAPGNPRLRPMILQDQDAVFSVLQPYFFLLCFMACALPTTWSNRLNKLKPVANQPVKLRGGGL